METNNKEKEKKGFGGKIGRSITIVLLVFFGFWIGWDSGAYSYIKYLTYYKEKYGGDWMSEYIKILKEQEEANKNDFYGGNTPEETIDLFIAALKKGDYELASKYFVINKQEIVKDRFKNLDVAKIIDELTGAKKIWKKEIFPNDSVQFWYNIDENESSREINLAKNSNNKWKIKSMYIYYLAE